MNKLVELEERVQKMMDGERKRRDIALKFVQSLEELLLPVAPDLWGTGDNRPEDTAKTVSPRLYFRYETWYGHTDYENEGFYIISKSHPDDLAWGRKLSDFKGVEFWVGIQDIIAWIPKLIKQMEKKEETRDKIINLLK